MSETSIPPISENDATTPERSSPWVMLITMLLLISGLILSSAMLLHYAIDMNTKDGGSRASLFDFAGMFRQSREWSTKATSEDIPDASVDEEQEAQDSAVKRYFSGNSDGTVRWPKLKLTGFGKSSDAEGAFAIINGKHVLVNTSLGEVKLIEVRTHGAVVEYRGERKILTLDHNP